MFDQNEFKNLARTVMQVEYLLLTMVLLYIVLGKNAITNHDMVLLAVVVYAAILILMHLLFKNNLNPAILSGKAIFTFIFISFVVWHTGKASSPLINLYIIGVISSAMVLGRSTTLLLMCLVAVIQVFLVFHEYNIDLFSQENILALLGLIINVFALVLITYLTFMLSLHMQHFKEEIKNSAELDPLTGLLNRRTFTHILERDFERFARYSQHFSILVIDVDNIKTINNEYGYVVGNRLLVLIASILRRCTKQADLIARYGGDEYIILLAETGIDGALKVADKMRGLVGSTPLIIEGGKEIFVTLSIGAACYPHDSTDLEELVKRADLAMYESSESGKNRTTSYEQLFNKVSA